MNTQTVNYNRVITKAYVDQIQNDNERRRPDLGLDFYDKSSNLVKNNRDNDLNDKKLINLASITVSRNPTSDKEIANN